MSSKITLSSLHKELTELKSQFAELKTLIAPAEVPAVPLAAEVSAVPPAAEAPAEVPAAPQKKRAAPAAPAVTLSETERMLATLEPTLGKTLPCKHCHSDHVPIAKFAVNLAKYFKDGALTKVPKSCDKMNTINKRANPFNNPINNARAAIKKREMSLALASEGDALRINAELVTWRAKLAAATAARDEMRATA
jgi:hypothetical protein